MSVATIIEDCLLRLSANVGAFAQLDVAAKLEVLALSSMSACILGYDFPSTFSLAIALLALLAVRTRSDAQLIALCGFSVYTSVTDFVYIFTDSSSTWSSVMLILNIAIKALMATNAFRLFGSGEDGMSMGAADDAAAMDIGGMGGGGGGGFPNPPSSSYGGGSGGFPSASYIAPTVDATVDYDSMADAADKQPGDATRYRSI